MLTSAKPDLDAYNTATTMSTAESVTAVRGLLGAKLVAYLGKVTETRAVRQWAEGTRRIANPVDLDRLRVRLPGGGHDHRPRQQPGGPGLVPGPQPRYSMTDDRSPARVLRDGDLEEVGPQVLTAARQFAAVG